MADKDSTQQSEAMEQRAKSIFHTMMFDATADWLQSYTTSSSSGSDKSSEGKSTSPKKQDDVPRAEQILSPESSFDAPFVDDSDGDDDGYDNHTEKMQARGNTESFATAEEPKTTIREFDKADEPTNYVKVDEVEATDDQRDASDHLQAETSKSSRGESLVSMNSTSSSSSSSLQEKMGNNDVDSYGFSVEGDQSDLESDVSIASMEDEQEGLSNNPSFDSFETMQSELPPMISQAKVEIEPKADLQASWAAISASSSSSSSASSMEATADIFIRDKMYSWLPAKVLEHTHEYALVAIDLPDSWIDSTVMEKGDNFSMGYLHPSMKAIPTHEVNRLTNEFGVPSFQLRRVFFKEYEQGHLPLQNMQSEAKRDMADLMELHPAAILYNLKDRHYLHKPYTRVGDIVIAMNPCTWIKELYEPATREMYSKNLIWEGKSLYCRLNFAGYDSSLTFCVSSSRDGDQSIGLD